jgi:hypothetical protein
VIETAGKVADLIPPCDRQVLAEVAASHLAGSGHDLLDRPDVAPGEHDGQQRTDTDNHQCRKGAPDGIEAQKNGKILGVDGQMDVSRRGIVGDDRNHHIIEDPVTGDRLAEFGLEDHLFATLGDPFADTFFLGAGDDSIGAADDGDFLDPLDIKPLEIAFQTL